MIVQSDGYDATVYEYHGKGATGDIVSKVKSHHSDETDTNYHDLTARKIARGGRREQITVVVVIEQTI